MHAVNGYLTYGVTETSRISVVHVCQLNKFFPCVHLQIALGFYFQWFIYEFLHLLPRNSRATIKSITTKMHSNVAKRATMHLVVFLLDHQLNFSFIPVGSGLFVGWPAPFHLYALTHAYTIKRKSASRTWSFIYAHVFFAGSVSVCRKVDRTPLR